MPSINQYKTPVKSTMIMMYIILKEVGLVSAVDRTNIDMMIQAWLKFYIFEIAES